MTEPGFIPPHGGYEKLLSYQKTVIIYDATVRFCERFLGKRDRTVDQMVQAARSGKQNIIEGSEASATSKKTEITLTNVAKASLEELLEDYRDYLRVHEMPVWDKDSKEARYARNLGRKDGVSYADFKPFVETRDGGIVANLLICVINQATYLLKRQIRQLEAAFVKEGGIRERMTAARIKQRQAQQPKRKRL